jgi:hypothetical protein
MEKTLPSEPIDLTQPNNALWQAMSYFLDIDSLEEARDDMLRTLAFGSTLSLEHNRSVLEAFLGSNPSPEAVWKFVTWDLNHRVSTPDEAFAFLRNALEMMTDVLSNQR